MMMLMILGLVIIFLMVVGLGIVFGSLLIFFLDGVKYNKKEDYIALAVRCSVGMVFIILAVSTGLVFDKIEGKDDWQRENKVQTVEGVERVSSEDN